MKKKEKQLTSKQVFDVIYSVLHEYKYRNEWSLLKDLFGINYPYGDKTPAKFDCDDSSSYHFDFFRKGNFMLYWKKAIAANPNILRDRIFDNVLSNNLAPGEDKQKRKKAVPVDLAPQYDRLATVLGAFACEYAPGLIDRLGVRDGGADKKTACGLLIYGLFMETVDPSLVGVFAPFSMSSHSSDVLEPGTHEDEQGKVYSDGNTSVDSSEESTDFVEFLTYPDLVKRGLSALEIAEQLLENDRILYGDLGPHAGSALQWATQIHTFQQNWGFLCIGTKIIGNWSCSFLTAEQEAAMRAGTLLGVDITADRSVFPLPGEEVHIHILNASLNDSFRTTENWALLWRSFGDRLVSLARQNIFFKSISACLFRDDCSAVFRSIGFEFVTHRVITGEIYWIDLTSGIPSGLQDIMYGNELSSRYKEFWQAPITFRQLSSSEILDDRDMETLTTVFFSADPYIYPAMMKREQAKMLLPVVIETNRDQLFRLDNFFVAEVKGSIIGLILHKYGDLNWSSEQLRKEAENQHEQLPDSLEKAEKEYFTRYNDVGNSRSIITFAVHPLWRLNNIHVESKMMEAFIKRYGDDRLRLFVLRESLRGVRIYTRNGFQVQYNCNGWSADGKTLPCSFMVREPDPERDD